MARKSRSAQIEAHAQPLKLWRIALYIRLSREDGDKDESDSIANQRNLLLSYVKDLEDSILVDCFIDDGYSGTTFSRPEFNRMMDCIRGKTVNCVIVKDLSRFGRNYIEVGNYLEQIFPFLDVRFISVTEMLDSYKNPSQMNTVMIPFRNLMNDEYCRDISNKVRSTLDLKRKQGQFIGAFASYGYLKDPEQKGHLIVDEKVAPVIQEIFRLFLEGSSIIGIAKHLNRQGVPNPSAYKRTVGLNYRHPYTDHNDALWPDSSVRRILTNRIYTGDLVQGKNKTKSYKVQQSVSVPRSDWIVVPNTHEAIIDRETYDAVQQLLKRDTRTAPKSDRVYLFSGFVRCADCRRAMNYKLISQPYGKYHYFICSTFKKMEKGACTKHTIRNDKLEALVLAALKKQIELAVSMDELIANLAASGRDNRHSERLMSTLAGHRQEMERISKLKKGLYEDWKNGDLTREEYLRYGKEYGERSRFLDEIISRIETEITYLTEKGESENAFITSFKKHQNLEFLAREIVVDLIEMIYIHEGGDITIHFKFIDEYQRAIEYIEQNSKKDFLAVNG